MSSHNNHVVKVICVVVCLVVLGGALTTYASLAGSLESQSVAERWESGDIRFAQVSLFFQNEAGFSHAATAQFRLSIDNNIAAESIKAPNENARVWIFAFSGETDVSVSQSAASIQARAICTGGDFFTFHPLDMASGWYYSERDLMDDGVIIDRTLAWRLYGGYDLTGLPISIGGYPCRILGVSNIPDGKAEKESYGEEPTVFLPFTLMQKIGKTPFVTCYEAVLPDPVGGFALKTMKSAAPYDASKYEIVENSRRFSPKSSFNTIGTYAKRTQRTNSVFYPWWENSARYLENISAMFLLLAVISTIYPAVLLISQIYKLYKRRKTIIKDINGRILRFVSNKRPGEKSDL